MSTPLKKRHRGHRLGSHVACTDDIHRPVEKSGKNRKQQKKADNSAPPPPGHFISDDLERETARFIDEVKELAKRRKRRAGEGRHGPPKPDDDQRSRRR
ncbi:MAG: hypothetical protein ACRDNP_06170 [Gaiellaceae bacterium]